MSEEQKKQWFCPIVRGIYTFICPNAKSPLELEYTRLNKELNVDLKAAIKLNKTKEITIQDNLIILNKSIIELQELKDENFKLSYSSPMEKYWNEKRPYADVKYSGRYLPMSSKKISIPVQLYITPNDTAIISDIKMYRLQVKNPLTCNEDIVKIYLHTRTKPSNPYRYQYDIENLGVPEFWFFPFELRSAKKGDCDDWGNELASYLIAAGVPRYRVRCVVGNTWSGIGHHTVYVLGDDLKTWYHLNSTTGSNYIRGKKLEEFPLSNEPEDTIGIKNVWFSYNDKHAWNEFETEMDASAFKKQIKNIVINGGN